MGWIKTCETGGGDEGSLSTQRILSDIGITVQKQHHGGTLRIFEWAHLVNACVLAGDGTIEALAKTGTSKQFGHRGERGLVIPAEMTTKGSLATGDSTRASIESAKGQKDFVVGFVATRALTEFETSFDASDADHFVVFLTGINRLIKSAGFGQQYQIPESAVRRGADFIIAGLGVYAAEDAVEEAKAYKDAGWKAYHARTRGTGSLGYTEHV